MSSSSKQRSLKVRHDYTMPHSILELSYNMSFQLYSKTGKILLDFRDLNKFYIREPLHGKDIAFTY